MFTRRVLPLILILSGAALADTAGPGITLSSGDHQVALIELYTSEGCSSCPPADRWLSSLKGDPRLWTEFVPIALHVDYWNYIGWKDRFARRDFSDRQRRYISEGGAQVVYTPGFFVNGQEWQRWRTAEPKFSDGSVTGNLNIEVNGPVVAAHFSNNEIADSDLILHVALLGMNLETRVLAGENTGRTLRHDFVALSVAATPLQSVASGYKAITRLQAPSVRYDELALVAWVSDAQNQAPIQAVGGYLP